MLKGLRVGLLLAGIFAGGPGAGTLTGWVIPAEGGKAIPGAHVVLVKLAGGLGGTEFRDSGSTDAQGKFVFKKLEVAHWQVTASAPGRINSLTSAPIDDTADMAEVDVVLRKGTGMTKSGSVTGMVRDASNQAGLAKAKVILTKVIYSEKDGSTKVLPVDTVKTDSVGRYLLDSVEFRVDYRISVNLPGYTEAVDSAVTVAVEQTLNRNFDLEKPRGKGARRPGGRKPK